MAGRFVARQRHRAVILLYHRVAVLEADPWGLAVTPENFAAHLAVLQRRFSPLGLGDLRAILADGAPPPRSIAVTFDDGYADNLHAAKPLLERFEVPATVFLATDALVSTGEFWWDELDRLLLRPGRLPDQVELEIDGERRRWQLEATAQLSPDDAARHRRWRAEAEPPSARHALYLDLCSLLKRLPRDDRGSALARIRGWCDVAPREARPTHRTLSIDEARQLLAGGLVEVGAHTVTHPALAAVPEGEQRSEITDSRSFLEDALALRVGAFSYPFGGDGDYTSATVTAVREAGFDLACSNKSGVVTGTSNPFDLPRLYVDDVDPRAFERRLEQCLLNDA